MVHISSEIAPLKSVIIHRPGEEHRFVGPHNIVEWVYGDGSLVHNPDYLLFDDLIQPERAADEHDQLKNILNHFTGKDHTIQFTDLLTDILKDVETRNSLINECCVLEDESYDHQLSPEEKHILNKMSVGALIHVLLSGVRSGYGGNHYFKYPIPNLIFTRDIAAVVGNTVILTWGRRRVRKRENILTKYIFTHHPLFTDVNIYDFHSHHPKLSVEGGDILVFGGGVLCIGISERTSTKTVNALLPLFFEQGFHHVYAVNLPKLRSLMHLDTIFTRINTYEVLVYPPLFLDGHFNGESITTYRILKGQCIEDVEPHSQTLLSLMEEDGITMTAIKCGGDITLNQDREQWTLGANAFTIKPGIIIGYERNHHTLNELELNGYQIVSAYDFLTSPQEYSHPKLMITIIGSELSRGRGGARCLTLPLEREISHG